jgi:hypothetical protein
MDTAVRMSGLYQKIEIWRRGDTNGSIKKYNVFLNLITRRYYVVSADHLYSHIDKKADEFTKLNVRRLFMEEDIEQVNRGFDSLEEAIRSFDDDFS